MKPILKWVGGKTQILEDVFREFPTEIQSYHEPFIGGGSVLFELLSKRNQGEIFIEEKIYASDININLISLYKNIQSNPNDLVEQLQELVDILKNCENGSVNRKPMNLNEARTSQESYYYWIRKQFNEENDKTTVASSAKLIFLNKMCFRGLYREGPHGFNVPYGNYKNPSIYDADHIHEISQLIANVEFQHCSFEEALDRVQSNDFIYMDPPYAPETDKSFVNYTSDGFNLEKHKLLFQKCTQLPCKFLMSNSDVIFVKEAFPEPEYKTKIISCRRAINSKKPDSRTNEILISKN